MNALSHSDTGPKPFALTMLIDGKTPALAVTLLSFTHYVEQAELEYRIYDDTVQEGEVVAASVLRLKYDWYKTSKMAAFFDFRIVWTAAAAAIVSSPHTVTS